MTQQYKNPFEDPDEKLWDEKVKDYKIPERKEKSEPKPAEPLEERVGPEALKEGPEANIEFRKYYLTSKLAAKALTRFLREYKDDITSINFLNAYTKDKIKFEDGSILKAIKNGKELVRFCGRMAGDINAKKNGTNITLRYESTANFWDFLLNIEVELKGKEDDTKKEREVLSKLLGGKK